jgi:hypothetical protein
MLYGDVQPNVAKSATNVTAHPMVAETVQRLEQQRRATSNDSNRR